MQALFARNTRALLSDGAFVLRTSLFHSKKRAPKPDPPIYSKSRVKRFPMTTKRANKNYYKGNGCRTEGRITNKGRFIMDPEMCTELVVPDLTGFRLKAYISSGTKKNIRDAVVAGVV